MTERLQAKTGDIPALVEGEAEMLGDEGLRAVVIEGEEAREMGAGLHENPYFPQSGTWEAMFVVLQQTALSAGRHAAFRREYSTIFAWALGWQRANGRAVTRKQRTEK